MTIKLECFINDCNNRIIETHNIKAISKKIFYTPLENALISESTQCFIDTLAGSDIVLREFDMLLAYIPSPLNHSFNYYSSFTAAYRSSDRLCIHPSTEIFPPRKFHWTSRILPIDFDTLLIIGGAGEGDIVHNNCISLNINSKVIKDLPNMNAERMWHAITWLNGLPCVIGGHNGTSILKSVEILTGDKWTEISPLNIARRSSTAISNNGIMWCFGGITENKDYELELDTIEKFENDNWKVLEVRLSQPCSCIGALYLENQILLYGGRNTERISLDQAYILDTSDNIILKAGNINQQAEFYCYCLQITSSNLFVLGVQEQVDEFSYFLRERPYALRFTELKLKDILITN